MKRSLIIIAVLFATILSSCKNTNTPDQFAIKFLNAMYICDFDLAKDLSTKNTWPIINGLKKNTSHLSEDDKMELVGKLKVEILDVKAETDSTDLIYFKTTPDFQIFKAIKILKQTDEEGNIKFKVDNSSTDSLSGADDFQLNEVILPFQEEVTTNTDTTTNN
jgi:hypothetical protein